MAAEMIKLTMLDPILACSLSVSVTSVLAVSPDDKRLNTKLISKTKKLLQKWIIIVIQMEDVLYFTPNIEKHKEFADVLKEAEVITKEERRRLIEMIKAMDDTEKMIALVTLLKLNGEKEFVDLSILTNKEIDCIDII